MQKHTMTAVLPKNVLAPFLAIGATLLLLSACGKETGTKPGGFPSPAVSVAEVLVRNITPWKEFNGRIEAKEVVRIRPRVGGVIEKIQYHEGDVVNQGDPLFIIDQHPFRAELNRAEAELGRAHAQAELARAEIRRAKTLVARELLSQDEYDRRVAAENQADANVRSARASVKLANLNLGYTEIRSPITGRAGRALVTKGNLVSSTSSTNLLTTVLSLDPVYVMFDIDELSYLQYFGHSQPSATQADRGKRTVFVGLSNEHGFPRQGYVNFVDNQVAANTGTIRVRAVLDNKDYHLVPGLFARLKLMATKPEQAIFITDDAVLTDQDRKFVYVLGKENKATRRDVTLGRTFEGFRLVTKGLKPGERIIVHGIQKVFFPNMPVVPQFIAMGDPPPSPGSKPAAPH